LNPSATKVIVKTVLVSSSVQLHEHITRKGAWHDQTYAAGDGCGNTTSRFYYPTAVWLAVPLPACSTREAQTCTLPWLLLISNTSNTASSE
jgi:hypothetical protein